MNGTVVIEAGSDTAALELVMRELAAVRSALVSDDVSIDVVIVVPVDDPIDTTVDAAVQTAAELGVTCTTVTAGVDSRHRSAGVWSAHRAGFAEALGHHSPDLLVTLDPAGHHDARQLPDLIRAFRSTGAGVIVGSRWIRGGSAPGTPPLRRALSRAASLLVSRATGMRRVRDVTTSFRVIRADTAELVASAPVSLGEYGYHCEFVAVAQAYGFSVSEAPITFRPRLATIDPLTLGDLTCFWSDLRRIRARIARIRSDVATDQAAWAARSGRMREQSPTVGSDFGAMDELNELSGARHFLRWIVDGFDRELGRHVLEVGAGIGAIAAEIASRDPQRTVTAIEPARNVFDELESTAAAVTNLDVRHVTSRTLVDDGERYDSVVYVNVLEHIHDDLAELRTGYRLLRDGGSLAVFVPAGPGLYGSLDYKSGHYRRYDAATLHSRLETAGFVDVDVRYLDVVGIVPYWLMYRVADVSRLGPVSAGGYDRVIVPVSRLVQRLWPRPPFGKNLSATARRP